MDSQRWLVLILLGTSLGGVIAYLVVLGRRLKRLKQILAQSPRESAAPLVSAQPGKKGPAGTRRGGASPGLALAQEAEWVDESISTQRAAAAFSAPVHLETGASMLERSASAADTTAQAAPGGSGEGDLLKKLLTFDSGRAGEGSEPAAPPQEAARPALARPADLLGTLGAKALQTAPVGPAIAGKPSDEPPITMGRLGAFMAQDVGAPESAKPKHIPVATGPSFSLGSGVASAPGAEPPLRRSPLDLMKGAAGLAASRDRGVPVSQALGEQGKGLAALLEEAAPAESSPLVAAAREPAAAPAARDSSIMGRLGGLSGGSSRLSSALEGGGQPAPALRVGPRPSGESGGGAGSPLSSLMGRLGTNLSDGSSTPFTLDSLKSAGADRPQPPIATPTPPAGPVAGPPSRERQSPPGSAAGGALQRLSMLSKGALAAPPAAAEGQAGALPPAAPGVAGSLAALSRLSLKPAGAGPAGVSRPSGGASQIDRLKAVAAVARPPEAAAESPAGSSSAEPGATPPVVPEQGKKKLVLNFKTLGSARGTGGA